MLELKVHDGDREIVLMFEHSLRTLSKWEAKYQKPFLSTERNAYELIDYFQEMIQNDADPNLVYRLSPEQLEILGKYINERRTASTVPREPMRHNNEQVTSELVYYWMGEMKINWEAQDWHYSRLMTLIEITNYKRQPEKKQRGSDFAARFRAANEANRKKFNSNG